MQVKTVNRMDQYVARSRTEFAQAKLQGTTHGEFRTDTVPQVYFVYECTYIALYVHPKQNILHGEDIQPNKTGLPEFRRVLRACGPLVPRPSIKVPAGGSSARAEHSRTRAAQLG